MNNTALPLWVEYARALALPAIAAFAAAIAYLQYKVASQKRSDDLFERRYTLFVDSCDLVTKFEASNVSLEGRVRYVSLIMGRALLLFDSDFVARLEEILKTSKPADFQEGVPSFQQLSDHTLAVAELGALFKGKMSRRPSTLRVIFTPSLWYLLQLTKNPGVKK